MNSSATQRSAPHSQHCFCNPACEAPPVEPPITRSRPRLAPREPALEFRPRKRDHAGQGRPRGAPREPLGVVHGAAAAAPRATTTNGARCYDVRRQSRQGRSVRYWCGRTSKEHRRLRDLAARRHPLAGREGARRFALSLIHISEPTRPERISYAVFCLKKKKRL